MHHRLFIVSVCLLFGSGIASAQSSPESVVLRAPQGISVNGDDTDWKGVPLQFVKGNQGEIAQFKLAYDGECLFALVTVRDASPLKNSTSANDPAMMLKTGDAIGLTFGPSSGQGTQQRFLFGMVQGQPTTVVYRPKSTEKKPYSFESPVGKVTHDYVATVPDARVAFKTVAGGYNAEIALPWTVLGYTGRDGFSFPFDLQVILSDAAGHLNSSTAWWHSIGSGPTATVDLPTEARLYPELWGKARLYLTPPLIAEKANATQQPRGVPIRYTVPKAAKVSLNITDASGNIVREMVIAQPHSAGTYTTYWNGRDEYGDPLPPGKYNWKALIFDGIGSKRIGGAANSARPPFRTPDGKGDLGAVHGAPAGVAADAQGIYHLSGTEEGNQSLTKLNPAGFTIWKRSAGSYGNGAAIATSEKYAAMIVQVGGKAMLISLNPQNGTDFPVGDKGARFEIGDDKLPIKGLSIVGDKAYYGLPSKDQIGVFNFATGQSEAPLSVTSPRDLVRFDASHLLIISGNKLLKWNVGNGQSMEVITGLDEPHAVTLDSKGQIYVGEWGKKQQISKFSPQGKLLLSIGKAGGRPATTIPYDPDTFYKVRSLCVASDGNLWFLEESELRRAGVFSPEGKWLRDVFQTPPSQGGAGVDIDDPVRVYFHTGYASAVAQARIDFAANALDPANPASYWKIEAIYNMTATGDYTTPGQDDVAAQSTGDPFYDPIAFTATNGKRYLWHEGNSSSLRIKENGRLVPIHVIGTNLKEGTLFPKGKKFSWSDVNGDGKFSANEVDFNETGADGWRWIDKGLTLYGNGGTLKPYKIDARGVPFYRRADWKPDITQGRTLESYFRDGSYGIFPSPPAPDGARYSIFNMGAGQQTSFWDRATFSRIARVKDGKIQWIAGQHDGTKRNPGGATFLWRPLGEVDGVMVVGDVDFHLLAYTNDGFALGGVTPHSSQGVTPETIVQENVQAGHFIKDPKTGKPLIVIGSGTEVLVLEVTGLESAKFQRIGGEITLTNAEAASTQTPGQYSILYRTWPQRDNGRFMDVTGDGWGWRPEIPWLQIKDGQNHLADVRLRRDAGTLQIYATILDSTPLAAQKEAKFGASEGLELLIGPADNRTTPIAGDTRFFLSAKRDGDKLQGVLLAKRLVDGNAEFTEVPNAKVAARESLNGNGYHLEAEIPLGFLPELTREREVTYIRNYQPGATRPGDFVESYTNNKPDLPGPLRLNVAIWQNEGAAVRRIPWVQDEQTATSTPNPAKWGMANSLVSLEWPYVPNAKFNIYRSTSGRLEDAELVKTASETDFAGDTPGIGSFTYWVEAIAPKATPRIAGPQMIRLDRESNSEPVLNFNQWRENPAAPFEAVAAQKLFPGSTAIVDVDLSAKSLTATSSAPQFEVKTSRLDENRWRLTLKADSSLPADFSGTVKLAATLNDGKNKTAEFEVGTGTSRLAGLMTGTGGVLAIDSAKMDAGQAVTNLDWTGNGTLERREIGSSGYVLFRHGGYTAAIPNHKIKAPFIDTFTESDGFWYGDANGNMRFDVDGKVGKDAEGNVRFGSVNSNAGTPEAGPGASWKIEVNDNKPHYITVFTPAVGPNSAKQRFTLMPEHGEPQTVEFDGSQGGAVIQFGVIGNATLSVQQTVGGMGSSNPGANTAALFLD